MLRGLGVKRGPSESPAKGTSDGPPQTTPPAASLEEAVTVLFCLIDDAYRLLNPRGDGYGALKRLSDSEVITLALFQQLRGVETNMRSCATPRSLSAGRAFAAFGPGRAGAHG